MKKSVTTVLAALLWGAAAAAPIVTPLPELSRPEAWQANPLLPLSAVEGKLAVGTKLVAADGDQQLLLKKPLPLPPGQEPFFDAVMEQLYPTKFNWLVEDAQGNTFLFYTSGYGSLKLGNYLGGRFRGGLDRIGTARIRCKGLSDPVRESWKWLSKPNSQPVPPLKLLGFVLNTEMKEGHPGNKMYLSNFRLTDASYRNEPFYYLFKDEEHYGSADGDPQLELTDLAQGGFWGKKFVADWELRNEYAGQPILTGSKTVELAPDDQRSLFLALAGKKLTFHVRNQGTYWLRIKVRGSYQGEVPTFIRELEFRYEVLKGEPARKFKPIAAEATIGSSGIRLAPERTSLIWKQDEPWLLRARFTPGVTGKVTVLDRSQQTVATAETTDGTLTLDLNQLHPGAYTVRAEEWKNGKVLDRTERLIGKEFDETAANFALPPGIPSAQEIRDGGEPLVLFCPMIHEKAKFVQHHIRLFDEMVKAKNAREIEIQISWPELEPLPGIYDFTLLDAILAEAQKRNIRCFVTLAPFSTPEWAPAFYTQNAEGYQFGHNAYLFHGGRQNVFQVPYLRERGLAFLRAMVLHTRNHPALLGYFYISEHSGEAPWKGWYEGFDPWTKANFRKWAQTRYGTIARANAAWQTAFPDFGKIEPPTVKEECAARFRRDWLLFRREATHNFIVECVKTIRELDPHRIIMLYLDGVIYNRLPELAQYNVISANGGCAVPERGFLMRVVADAGVPQRAEEISCSHWANFPTQLDISLFNMMAGGGANSHVKMFINQNYMEFEKIRRAPWALDRFEKFIPIWKELRGARVVDTGVAGYADFEGSLTRGRTVNFSGLQLESWNYRQLLESQLDVATNVTPAWRKAKLVTAAPDMNLMTVHDADELVSYVQNGGTLVMHADVGRKSVENDSEDWVLLRRFGFPPPVRELHPSLYSEMEVAPDSPWARSGKSFRTRIRTPFVPAAAAGEVRMQTPDGTPALTVRPFGQGRVFVIWNSEVIPFGNEKMSQSSESFFRAIAEEAGCRLPVQCDSRLPWTHFLQKGDTSYLLVMLGEKRPAGTFHFQFPQLPGPRRWTELISGRSGEFNGTLPVELTPMQVAIYRITKP